MPFPLFLTLTLALALAIASIMPAPAAHASNKKPGGRAAKGKAAAKGPKRAGKKGPGRASGQGGSKKPAVAWPAWMFPHMGLTLELERAAVVRKLAERDMMAAAHAWDAMRSAARLVLGPRDLRVWAALARSAASLLSFAGATGGRDSELKERALRSAASMAAGAVAGLADALEPLPSDIPPGNPPRPADDSWDWEKARDAEAAFAEKVLGRILDLFRDGDVAEPARSLGEAMYPGTLPEAGEDPFPSSVELRARLAEAEGPGGPGPGSREALTLRSVLGYEIADSEGWEDSDEALSLLEEAAAGLEGLFGAGDPDALAAKERLARRLFRMFGPARILPSKPYDVSRGDMERAQELFRQIRRSAPEGRDGDPLRRRAELADAGIAFAMGDGSGLQQTAMTSTKLMAEGAWIMEADISGTQDVESARCGFDMGELMIMSGIENIGSRFHGRALYARRNLLGARHPETACSIARQGDIHISAKREGQAFASWSLALEALEGKGERHERFVADLEYRAGRVLMFNADCTQAAPLMRRAEERFRRVLGDMSQEALKAASLHAQSLYWALDVKGAEEIYARLAELLDGVPFREGQDPTLPSDRTVLSTALAGLGAALVFSGDHRVGTRLLARSEEMCSPPDGEAVASMGFMYRTMFLHSDGGPSSVVWTGPGSMGNPGRFTLMLANGKFIAHP
ncbi:MAG: hypothetical protein LBQ79_09210 [Deltaproteobacteria bacterium]|jgi:hypothetical protein|nr:hypothetical protein [Deltaproteobacteria bacterium]